MPAPPTESITLEPAPSRWVDFVRERRPRVPAWLAPSAATFRSQLGLPPGPLVMSGHQAILWHPGILAKYIAADSCARAAGAASAWVVVDQDTPPPHELAWPSRASATSTRVVVGTHGLDYASPCDTEVPACARPPLAARANAGDGLLIDPAAALPRLRRVINSNSNSPNAALQITRVIESLLPSSIAPVLTFFATSIARTDFFAALVRHMRADPRRCIEAYNAAALSHLGADIRPLDANALELPLWHIQGPLGSAARDPVHANELASIPTPQLAPRALLMTALLRLAACDLFIHGTGGLAYDRVTDAWLASWLGADAVPAPTALATATLFLPLDATPENPLTSEAIAAQRAYRDAFHKPGALGEQSLESERRSLVANIAASPYRSAERQRRYHDLQQLLTRYRAAHAPAIEARRLAALSARTSAKDRAASVRTWAFPLYPESKLTRLRDDIHRAFTLSQTSPAIAPSSSPTTSIPTPSAQVGREVSS
ncbi:MAG: hypothetical protein JNL50_02295 [Phycisphaerae bacterium]|nr:hypothetical protein [Phycisphaerae bacterium]